MSNGEFIKRGRFSTKYGVRKHNHTSNLSVFSRVFTLVFEIESMHGDKWLTTLEPQEVDDLILTLSKYRSVHNG